MFALRQDLAQLVPDARPIVATHSGHNAHQEPTGAGDRRSARVAKGGKRLRSGLSAQLVGLLRYTEEVVGAAVGARHTRLLAIAGDRGDRLGVAVVQHRQSRPPTICATHPGMLAGPPWLTPNWGMTKPGSWHKCAA